MKKKLYIGGWILFGTAVAACITIMILLFGPKQAPGEQGKPITIYDAKGKALLQTTSAPELYDLENWVYLEMAVDEAVEIVSQKENCSTADARERLFSEGYEIHTAFDPAAFAALKEAKIPGKDYNTAFAMTDLQGGLVAVYCEDTKGRQVNYLTQRHSPYSSFKALSVYTPAVEQGKITWSSLYHDSPYKQMKDESGAMRDWPSNASNTYSQENTTVYEALKKSLNTVAVKCLADLGVSQSITFLKDSFGIPLKEESYVLETYGADEVIGSIALGYLETGVTPVEMAGYYQIFGNGGQYAAPKAVKKITLDGKQLYEAAAESKQVIRPESADLMNRLLRGVVAPGGTGAAAACYNVEAAGKTGTGDDYADNWFVGVTPGYSLAVWHDKNSGNDAGELFSLAIQKLYETLPGANTKFVTHKNLYQLVYCVHSGKAFSEKCTTIDTGYYTDKAALQTCDACAKN